MAKLSESRFSEDLGNRIDLLDAQARALQLEADRLEAENQVGKFQAKLTKIIGEKIPVLNRLKETELTLHSVSSEDWWRKTLDNSPVLQLRQQQKNTARNQLRNAHSAFLPSLSLDASIIEEETDLSVVSRGENNQTKELALVLDIPIFSGGSVSAQGQEKKNRYQAATYAVDEELRNLKESVGATYQQLVTQQQRLGVLNKALKSAKDAQFLHRQAQKEGLESQIDTLTSERALYVIKRSLVRARFDVLLSQIELERLSGHIGGDLLVKLDKLLGNDKTLNEMK